METQSDIRQTDQDAERGSSFCPIKSRGLSLPSLSEWTKPAGHRGSGAPSGSTQNRSPGLMGATKPELWDGRSSNRRQSLVSGSPRLVLGLQQQTSSPLSQSAPSVMVPLLDSNTLLLARAHIQSRLVSQENDRNGRNSPMPAPPPHVLPRTPKLLAPLDCRTNGPTAPHQRLQPMPLKPIRGTPSRNVRTLLRRERHVGPHTPRGGSEESSSSSSSSRSSIDLEDEEEEVERGLMSTYFLEADAVRRDVEAKTSGQRLHFVRHSTLVHSLPNVLDGDQIIETRVSCDTGKPLPSDSVGVHMNTEQVVFENDFVQLDQRLHLCVDNEMHHQRRGDYPEEGGVKVKHCQPVGPCSQRQRRLGRVQEDVVPSLEKNPQSVNASQQDVEEVKPRTVMPSTVSSGGKSGQCLTTTVNLTLSQTKCQREVTVSPAKPAKTKEKQTNGKIRNGSTVSATQVKTRVRKTPNLVINGEATVSSVKSKPNSVKVVQHNADTPLARKSISRGHRTNGKGPNSDRSNNKRPHVIPAARELKSARQPKRTSMAVATPRSKSAVDFISYRDMFQTIHSGDGGPAIYEMFAGPMYDKQRISSSCENPKEGEVSTPPVKSHHTVKVKKQPLKKPLEHRKLRRSPAEKMVVSSNCKRKPVINQSPPTSKVESRLADGQKKDTHKMEDVLLLDLHSVPELFLTDESGEEEERYLDSSSDRGGDPMLSVIQEVQSGYGSETLKPEELSTARRMEQERSSPRQYFEDGHYGHEISPHKLRTSSALSSSHRGVGETYDKVPEPVRSQSPLQTRINTLASHKSNGAFPPVCPKLLDEVGEGQMTDELLKCLAAELISLDETDTSICLSPPNCQSLGSRGKRKGPGMPEQVSSTLDSVSEDTITWTKGEVLGRGAYGTVFCGLTDQGTLIAVKQVSLDTSEPGAADREYSRLQEEVELLKTLTHTNIVGFLGTSLRQHMVSIFMEYVPGGSISSVLHRFGPLPEHVLSLYSHQILEGVAYLHLNRVIHRDLKGNNIMLMPTGVVKLIDFGCARRLSRLNHTGSHSGDLIKSVHGTPYWMAPEVINESGYGRKSDIWSVGCTVFEMATGKPPLAHMDKLAALFYIGAKRGSMPSLPDCFSRHARTFVDTCLISDQKMRPSAEQLLKHPFIPNKIQENSPESQKRACCASSHHEELFYR